MIFSPDGKMLTLAGTDNAIKLLPWPWPTVEDSRILSGHTSIVTAAVFSPNGKLLASASKDSIKLWDWPSGSLRCSLGDSQGIGTAIAFSTDGNTLASASVNNSIKLWNMSQLYSHPDPSSELRCAFRGDSLNPLLGHKARITAMAFSLNDQYLISTSRDNTLRLWDISEGTSTEVPLPELPEGTAVAFRAEDKTLALGGVNNTIELWTWPSPHPSRNETIRSIDEPNENKSIKSQDRLTEPSFRIFRGHTGEVTAVAFSPDGKTLISASRDNTLKLWDTSRNSSPRNLSDQISGVTRIAFSPDGNTVAVDSDDGTTRLWDLATGQLQMHIVLLPNAQWLAYHPQTSVYNASQEGEQKAWVQFDKPSSPVYPLHY
jgi:WD40 repeat protein